MVAWGSEIYLETYGTTYNATSEHAQQSPLSDRHGTGGKGRDTVQGSYSTG